MSRFVTIDYAAFDRNRKMGAAGERDVAKAEPIFCVRDQRDPKEIQSRAHSILVTGAWQLHYDPQGNAGRTGSGLAISGTDVYPNDYNFVLCGASLKRLPSDKNGLYMPHQVMHINQTLLRKNRADGGHRPVFAHRDRRGRGLALHAWGIRSKALDTYYPQAYFMYSPFEALLPCGARLVWVAETNNPVELLDSDMKPFSGLAYAEACAGGCPIEQFERFEAPESVIPFEANYLKEIEASMAPMGAGAAVALAAAAAAGGH